MTDEEQVRPGSGAVAVGGATGGTAVVALVQSIGPSTPVGEVLTFLTPVLTVALGFASYYLQLRFDQILTRQRATGEPDEFKLALTELRRLSKSRHISKGQRARFKALVDEADGLAAERVMVTLRASVQTSNAPGAGDVAKAP